MTKLLAVVALMLTLTACDPTDHPDCDRQHAPRAVATQLGLNIDCDPDFPGIRPDTGTPIIGWSDEANSTAWIWPENISRLDYEHRLRKVMWHELGHLRHHQLGGDGSNETWADGYAWCREPFPELSYSLRPTAGDCRTRFLR